MSARFAVSMEAAETGLQLLHGGRERQMIRCASGSSSMTMSRGREHPLNWKDSSDDEPRQEPRPKGHFSGERARERRQGQRATPVSYLDFVDLTAEPAVVTTEQQEPRRPGGRHHDGKQRLENLRAPREISADCPILHSPRRQHRPQLSGDDPRKMHQQQPNQEEHGQDIRSHHTRQAGLASGVKREHATAHTHAMASPVVTGAAGRDTRGVNVQFTDDADTLSYIEEAVYVREAAASHSESERPASRESAAESRAAAPCPATETINQKVSPRTAAVPRKDAAGYHFVRSLPILRSAAAAAATASVSACDIVTGSSSAAAGQDARASPADATAFAACTFDVSVARRPAPDGAPGGEGREGGTSLSAPPRRKQLSGAQKRKRKRELMSRCRVEQTSLLSFLATTVTSELILNDWYALESQLRDESAYFERLSSSAWGVPCTVPALCPISGGGSGLGSHHPGSPASREAGNAAVSYAAGSSEESPYDHPTLEPRREVQSEAIWTFRGEHPEHVQQRREQCEGQAQAQHRVHQTHGMASESQQHTTGLQGVRGPEQLVHKVGNGKGEECGMCCCFENTKPTSESAAADPAPGSPHHIDSSRTRAKGCGNCACAPPENRCSCSSNMVALQVSSGGGALCSGSRAACDAQLQDRRDPAPHSSGAGGEAAEESDNLPTTGSETLCGSSSSSSSGGNNRGRRPASISTSGPSASTSCDAAHRANHELSETGSTVAVCAGIEFIAAAPPTALRPCRRTLPPDAEEEASSPEVELICPTSSHFKDEDAGLPVERLASGSTSPAERRVSSRETDSSSTEAVERYLHHSIACYTTVAPLDSERTIGRGLRGPEFSSSVLRKECAEEEKDRIPGGTGGISSSRSSSGSTSCTTSIERSAEPKYFGSSLQQGYCEGFQAEAVSSRCTEGNSGEHCSPPEVPKRLQIAQAEPEGDLKEEGDPAGLHAFPRKVLQNGIRERQSRNAASLPSTAGAVAPRPVIDGAPLRSSSLPHPGRQQRLQNLRAARGAGDVTQVPEEEMQLAGLCNRIARPRDVADGLEETAEGDTYTRISSAEGLPGGAIETARLTFPTPAGDGDVSAASSGTRSSSSGNAGEAVPFNHKYSSLSRFTRWLRSSTPPSSSIQKGRHPSSQLSGIGPGAVGGLLTVWKRRNLAAPADDEASTASSSPVPVLQQLPTPLLWLPPNCESKKLDSLSPCSSFSDTEPAAAVNGPLLSGSARVAGESAEPPPLRQTQRLSEQQDGLQQQPLQASPQASLQQSPAQQQQHEEEPLPPPEQNQEHGPDLGVRSCSRGRDNDSSTKVPVWLQASGGAGHALQSQAGRGASAAAADDPLSDPALWPSHISEQVRISLVKRGPVQIVDFDFPRDSTQRRFGRQHYWRTAATGERYWRSWLVYSRSKDAVYCFCCKLYSQLAKSVVSTGFRRWKGAAEVLRSHEQSKDHRTCMLQWKCMCVKVGADLAFGDLMQLWLPGGSPTASSRGLPTATAAASSTASAAAAAFSSATGTAVAELHPPAPDAVDSTAETGLPCGETVEEKQQALGNQVSADETETRGRTYYPEKEGSDWCTEEDVRHCEGKGGN